MVLNNASVRLIGCLVVALLAAAAFGQQSLDSRMHHLRSGEQREWDEFAEVAEGKELIVRFEGKKNEGQHTLRLRQRDVKQPWGIRLNDKEIGALKADEKDTVIYLSLHGGAIRVGANELKIHCKAAASAASDDIMVGDIAILPVSTSAALGEATISVEVIDSDT